MYLKTIAMLRLATGRKLIRIFIFKVVEGVI